MTWFAVHVTSVTFLRVARVQFSFCFVELFIWFYANLIRLHRKLKEKELTGKRIQRSGQKILCFFLRKWKIPFKWRVYFEYLFQSRAIYSACNSLSRALNFYTLLFYFIQFWNTFLSGSFDTGIIEHGKNTNRFAATGWQKEQKVQAKEKRFSKRWHTRWWWRFKC